MTTSVSGGAPSNVIGRPTSLLNEDGLAWVRYRVAHTAAAMSLVEVFPFAPVIATTVPSNPRRSSAARSRSAWPVSATRTAGPSTAASAPDERRAGASFERLGDERVAVAMLAGERDEQPAVGREPRVGLDAADLDVVAVAAPSPSDRARHRGERAGLHRASARAAIAARATSRSSNGNTAPPTS